MNPRRTAIKLVSEIKQAVGIQLQAAGETPITQREELIITGVVALTLREVLGVVDDDDIEQFADDIEEWDSSNTPPKRPTCKYPPPYSATRQ